MPRPKKWRKVESEPSHDLFKPAGVPKSKLETINLKIEELEAMRLKDIEALSQAECAEKMAISRQTFQLIIDSARKKVAQALLEGKSIHITGGNYTYNICKYECLECHEIFELNYEGDGSCPKCGSSQVKCFKTEAFCRMKCCRFDHTE